MRRIPFSMEGDSKSSKSTRAESLPVPTPPHGVNEHGERSRTTIRSLPQKGSIPYFTTISVVKYGVGGKKTGILELNLPPGRW